VGQVAAHERPAEPVRHEASQRRPVPRHRPRQPGPGRRRQRSGPAVTAAPARSRGLDLQGPPVGASRPRLEAERQASPPAVGQSFGRSTGNDHASRNEDAARVRGFSAFAFPHSSRISAIPAPQTIRNWPASMRLTGERGARPPGPAHGRRGSRPARVAARARSRCGPPGSRPASRGARRRPRR